MAKWQKDGIALHPLFKFKCLGCKDPKATFTETGFLVNNFPIYNDKPEEYNSYALDRTFICDLCCFRVVFGIAISKEHYDAIGDWMTEKEKEHIDKAQAYQKIQKDLDEAKERVFKTV